jgi:iron(III) transport system substrate-binding protein
MKNVSLPEARWLRRATVVSAAAILLGTMVGCAGAGGATSAASASHASGSPLSQAEAWFAKNEPQVPVSLIKKACSEGQFSLYATVNAGFPIVMKDFENDVPCIKTDLYQASGGALTTKFQTEQAAGQYNADGIVNSSAATLDQWVSNGLLAKFTPVDAKRVPAAWQTEGGWYTVGINDIVVAYNTNTLTSAQLKAIRAAKTWKDVLNLSGLQGKAGIVDIQAGGSVQLAMYTLSKVSPKGIEDLKSTFDPQIFASAVPMANALAQGSIDLIAGGESSSIITAWTQGAPIEWIYPTPTGGIVAAYGVVAKAKHPAAAQLFESWSLTKAGQISWSKNGGFSPVPIKPAIPDERSFATESWFHAPTNYLSVTGTQLSAAATSLTTQFNSVFH